MPFGDAAVRRHSSVQLACRNAILIHDVAADHYAEPLNVEECVLQLQGIKRPLDQINAIAQRIRERDAADDGTRTTLAEAADEFGIDLETL